MTQQEHEAREILHQFGQTLMNIARDNNWDVPVLSSRMRLIADVAEKHATDGRSLIPATILAVGVA